MLSKPQVSIIQVHLPMRNPHNARPRKPPCYRLHGLLKGLLEIPRQWNFLKGPIGPTFTTVSLLNGVWAWVEKKPNQISMLIKTSWCHRLGLTRKMRPFCENPSYLDLPWHPNRWWEGTLSTFQPYQWKMRSMVSRGLCQLHKKHHIGPMGQVYVPTYTIQIN